MTTIEPFLSVTIRDVLGEQMVKGFYDSALGSIYNYKQHLLKDDWEFVMAIIPIANITIMKNVQLYYAICYYVIHKSGLSPGTSAALKAKMIMDRIQQLKRNIIIHYAKT